MPSLKLLTRAVRTFESLSLGDANTVDHLVTSEHGVASDFLLEMIAGKVNLIGHGSTVQLDFHDVGLLLATTEQLLLGVADDPHNRAVLLDLIEFLLNLFLAQILLPFLAGFGESLLFGLGPEKSSNFQKRERGNGEKHCEAVSPPASPSKALNASSVETMNLSLSGSPSVKTPHLV